MAYAVIRLGESFVCAYLLAAWQPDVDGVNRRQRVLFDGLQVADKI